MALTFQADKMNTLNYAHAAINATGLSKTYAGRVALSNLSLRVAPGEIYGLLGPNGAGKTTAFNILTTLSRPDSGSASVAGWDIGKDAGQVRRSIGVAFQETQVDKHLSGRQVLAFHGQLYGLSGARLQARLLELARLVELESVLDQPVHTYSGGMVRRLALIRSLLSNPVVLFLDEPTAGLDPQNRGAIWDYLQELRNRQALTIFFSTHYLEEAERITDRVGILEQGSLIAEGAPAALCRELGQELIHVNGSGNTTVFAECLQTQPWVTFVTLNCVKDVPTTITRRIHLDTDSEPADLLQIGLRDDPRAYLKTLVNLAECCGFQVSNLSINRPSLSEVFLKLTGRRLND